MNKPRFTSARALADIYISIQEELRRVIHPYQLATYTEAGISSAALRISQQFTKLHNELLGESAEFFIAYPDALCIRSRLLTTGELFNTKLIYVMLFLTNFVYQETKGVVDKAHRDTSLAIALASKCLQCLTDAVALYYEESSLHSRHSLLKLSNSLQHFPLPFNIPEGRQEEFLAALGVLAEINSSFSHTESNVKIFINEYVEIVQLTLMVSAQSWFDSL